MPGWQYRWIVVFFVGDQIFPPHPVFLSCNCSDNKTLFFSAFSIWLFLQNCLNLYSCRRVCKLALSFQPKAVIAAIFLGKIWDLSVILWWGETVFSGCFCTWKKYGVCDILWCYRFSDIILFTMGSFSNLLNIVNEMSTSFCFVWFQLHGKTNGNYNQIPGKGL